MSARCHWRWASLTRGGGAKLMIVALGCAFAFAGSPQLHKRVHQSSARPAHPCAITLRNAGRCVKPVARQFKVAVAFPAVALRSKAAVIAPVWVSALFLQVCC